jgi:tRNA pseudouridine55 synthase
MSTGPDGVAVVDKPAGCTSHDVVARVRRHLGTRKVGHAGTLDPDATGVLLLGVGRATRLLRYVGDLPKSYVGEVVLGVATTTLDAAGEVVATADMAGLGIGEVRAAAAGMVGTIRQVPPMVSAVQVGGRRLHELAREGVEVEREARTVTVWRFDVVDVAEPGVFRVAVDCSSGTYVRSLVADLGDAYCVELRRTGIGPFDVAGADPERLLPLDDALAFLPAIELDGEAARRAAHGVAVDRAADGPVRLRDGDGLIAIAEPVGGSQSSQVKPTVGFRG